MKRTIKLQLGRSSDYYFEETLDTDNKVSSEEVIKKYLNLFSRYRETHSISSRRWNFPIVYFKDDDGDFYPTHHITPNGSWEQISND